jgi:hypothetical protein
MNVRRRFSDSARENPALIGGFASDKWAHGDRNGTNCLLVRYCLVLQFLILDQGPDDLDSSGCVRGVSICTDLLAESLCDR